MTTNTQSPEVVIAFLNLVFAVAVSDKKLRKEEVEMINDLVSVNVRRIFLSDVTTKQQQNNNKPFCIDRLFRRASLYNLSVFYVQISNPVDFPCRIENSSPLNQDRHRIDSFKRSRRAIRTTTPLVT